MWGHVANPAPQPPGEQRLPQIILGVTQKLVGKQNHCAAFPGGIDRRRHDGKRDAPTFKDVMRVEQDQEGIGVQRRTYADRADCLARLEIRGDAFERRRVAGRQEHRGETFIHEVSFQNLFHCPSILALA